MGKLITKCNDCKKEANFLIQTTVRFIKNKERGHRFDHTTYMCCEDCNTKNIKQIKSLYENK